MKTSTTDRAKSALWKRFRDISTHTVDDKGYVLKPEYNLVEGLDISLFRSDFEVGSGHELDGKFKAVHSSSALAANTFGPFKSVSNTPQISIGGVRGLSTPVFERQLRTGLGGTPPNLDVFLESEMTVIGIESKCLEYFKPKRAEFSDSYNQKDRLSVEEAWWALLQELKNDENNSSYLDVAQLIKHYLGIRKQFAGKRRIILSYLFWEPENWQVIPECLEHRRAIERFSQRIRQSDVVFSAQSYPSLWAEWINDGVLPDHVARLQERYLVKI